jgi:CubicO group peptidase (beta-lactamase class C family)
MISATEKIDLDAARALAARAQSDVVDGQLPACALAVAYEGEVVFSEAFGAADRATKFVLMSPSKTVVDGAMWRLLADGSLKTTDRIADHIPEFGTNGKDVVTIEQVMTHTGGFPMAPIDFPEWTERGARLHAFSQWSLDFEPGSKFMYHPTAGSWVIAELIERASGTDYRAFIRSALLEPLGLADRVTLGAPVEQQGGVPTPVYVLPEADVAKLPPMFLGADGRPVIPAGLATAEGRAAGFPGAGVVATAEGVALLYQAYLHNQSGLWPADLLADVTGRVRVELPDMSGTPILRTLSMVTAGDVTGRIGGRGFFGATVSERAFGHPGMGGNLAWADPVSGLSFCYVTNGVEFLEMLPPTAASRRPGELSTLAGRLRGGS